VHYVSAENGQGIKSTYHESKVEVGCNELKSLQLSYSLGLFNFIPIWHMMTMMMMICND